MTSGIIGTVDGPAASGTSTLAGGLGARLGWPALNTGHLYRGLALVAKQTGASIHDAGAMLAIARSIRYEFSGGSVASINGLAVSEEDLRSVSSTVASVSHYPKVRERIRWWQHNFARQYPNLFAEGRDLGTVVFPEAQVKLFLECDDEVRARRMSDKEGRKVTVKELLDRDRLDLEREESPMVPAKEALIIDTTSMSKPELVDFVFQYMHSVQGVRELMPRAA